MTLTWKLRLLAPEKREMGNPTRSYRWMMSTVDLAIKPPRFSSCSLYSSLRHPLSNVHLLKMIYEVAASNPILSTKDAAVLGLSSQLCTFFTPVTKFLRRLAVYIHIYRLMAYLVVDRVFQLDIGRNIERVLMDLTMLSFGSV
jgi:hypothetical protein